MKSDISINGDRLWDSLMEMAKIGATAAGGCNRQALTDEDRIGRDLFVSWCEQAGCSVRVDQMGNIFARREGKDSSLAPILAGSHLDTQPTGGKYDGVFGVLSALEVIRSLNDHDIETRSAVEAVVWTNEEGVRFSPAMIGSGVWGGSFEVDWAHEIRNKQGKTLKAELERIGYLGATEARFFDVKAAFEVHIEQGPILEKQRKTIGIVQGVQGMRWYDLVITGNPCHAGPTPMEDRQDPMRAISEITSQLYALASEFSPQGRVTFGDVSAKPGSRNTVPEQIVLYLDMRHPEQVKLEEMDARMRQIVVDACANSNTAGEIRDEWNSPAVVFDPDCVAAVRAGVAATGHSAMDIVSGAGHDSVYLSNVVPTSMIFVPCENGLSHNEAENASPEDLAAGADVLLQAILHIDRY